MKRYGMDFSTIRFWQNCAKDLRQFNGIWAVGYLECALDALQRVDARQLGHDAIAAAFVHTPEQMRRLLETGNTEPAPEPEPVRYAYELSLTREEYDTLIWLESRGYAADLVKHADAQIENETGITLQYRESSAWKVMEEQEADPDAFTACAANDLARKMLTFIDRIV